MRRAALLLLPLALVACGDDEPPPATTSICDGFETPYDAYVAGLTKAGEMGLMQVSLLDASPAPPQKGDNTWTVQILDDAGQPFPAASLDDVVPWMPEHGHGTSVVPAIGDGDGEARFEVQQVDFRMAGVWTVTFEVTTTDGVDRAVFGICIDG